MIADAFAMSLSAQSHRPVLNRPFCVVPTVAAAVGDAGLAECGIHNCSPRVLNWIDGRVNIV
jgi:hypothetical protein